MVISDIIDYSSAQGISNVILKNKGITQMERQQPLDKGNLLRPQLFKIGH